MAKENKSVYKVIGVMAGSSMDGLDIVKASFKIAGNWEYELLDNNSFEYDEKTFMALESAVNRPKQEQLEIDHQFGDWIAKKLLEFGVNDVELIAVHGHTIIHKPEEGISWQLGNGERIAKMTGKKVITDFRNQDISLGGQGAPLVPIGDFELLSEFDACLNLGGIANISIRDKMIAWDICPCNQVLNYYARKLGHPFDDAGKLARVGSLNSSWLDKVRSIPFFGEAPPKSLPNGFIASELLDEIDAHDGLHSYSRFIAETILRELADQISGQAKVLVTGGGAYNSFLLENLNANNQGFEFQVPNPELIEFKEALVFGFLGLLKIRNEINVLSSVTGASRDTSSGVIHSPK